VNSTINAKLMMEAFLEKDTLLPLDSSIFINTNYSAKHQESSNNPAAMAIVGKQTILFFLSTVVAVISVLRSTT
jgi:hypothetical protein